MNTKLKNTFKKYLGILESNSTCRRVKVAAVIVKDGRTVSTGWNGVPSGFKHCEEILKKHHEFSEKYEVHAEANAISFAAKNNISTEGSSIFITITPCSNCAKLILQSGIKKVYYKDVYDRSSEGFDLLKEAAEKGKIELEKI